MNIKDLKTLGFKKSPSGFVFQKNPNALIQFLTSQNNKRFAVQITVDGLQGEYLKALTQEDKTPFLKQVYP